MKSYELRLSPAVMQVIKPILYDMSRIAVAQENNPAINPENEPAHIKKMKRSCVHIIYDAMGIPRPSLARRADSNLMGNEEPQMQPAAQVSPGSPGRDESAGFSWVCRHPQGPVQ